MRHFIAAQIILSSWAALVHGATILTSPEQMTPPTLLIGFEAFPNGQIVPFGTRLTNQWQTYGLLIANHTGEGALPFRATNNVPAHSGTKALSPVGGFNLGGYLDFRFVYPVSGLPATVQQVGIWVQNGDLPSTVTFYDSQDNVLETIMTDGEDFFAGLRATEGIARMRITDPDNFLADDIQYTPVPEPAALALAAIAACGFCWRRQ
jgi:hypothetical protein